MPNHKVKPFSTSPPTLLRTVTDDSTWTTGDFEIISADGVRFRIESYYLYANSEVFRDAAGLGRNSEPKVVMVDTEFENAHTIRLFLELICHGGFDQPMPRDCFGLVELVTFLDKWSCQQPQRAFWNIFELELGREAIQGGWAFQLAARGDKPALCELCLEVDATLIWAVPGSATATALTTGGQGESVWNSNHWPKTFFDTVPLPYLFALSRAYGSAVEKEGGLKMHLAAEFRKYINLAKSN